MRKSELARGLTALTAVAALLWLATPVQAQQPAAAPSSGFRAELIQDVEQLEQKYLALAEAMAGKYQWRPGPGVRSMGEVLTHVAGANFMLPAMAGVRPPEAIRNANRQELEQTTDEARVRELLRQSFAHARHAIAGTTDAQLDEPVRMFGQDASKRRVLLLLVTHMHEHLGQSIAYARSNGVVPPWSAGRGG